MRRCRHVDAAPAAPYSVLWTAPTGGQSTQLGELWPQIELSCGPSGGLGSNPLGSFSNDGSFGEPGVRVSQFANGFPQSVLASVCDPSYASAIQEIATRIAQLPIGQNCVTDPIQYTAAGLPMCTVTAQVIEGGTVEAVPYPNCATNGATPPCWDLNTGGQTCSGAAFSVTDAPGAPSASVTATCTFCNLGSSGVAGCR